MSEAGQAPEQHRTPEMKAGVGRTDAKAHPLLYCEVYSPANPKNPVTYYPNEKAELVDAVEPRDGRPLLLICLDTRSGKKFTVTTTLPFLLIRDLTPAQVYLASR